MAILSCFVTKVNKSFLVHALYFSGLKYFFASSEKGSKSIILHLELDTKYSSVPGKLMKLKEQAN